LILTLNSPPRKKNFQMTGKSSLNKNHTHTLTVASCLYTYNCYSTINITT
jgi:hypothetical protein